MIARVAPATMNATGLSMCARGTSTLPLLRARCSTSDTALKRSYTVMPSPSPTPSKALQVSIAARSSWRSFSTSPHARNASEVTSDKSSTPPLPSSSEYPAVLARYQGPMAKTFYRLKVFSFGSLVMATCFIPVFIFAPAGAELTMAGRAALCVTGLATSGGSTALVSWISRPYVGRMSLVQQSEGSRPLLEAYTLSWRLRALKTTIYEPAFIRPTSRPFASWELAAEPGTSVSLPQFEEARKAGETCKVLVSQTVDAHTGQVVGSWWAQNVPGTATRSSAGADAGEDFREEIECHGEGTPITHFQVHEELLGDDFRIL